MQYSTGNSVFSAEMNPYKRLTEKKKNPLFDILSKLSGSVEAGGFYSPEQEDTSVSISAPRIKNPSAPVYDPNKYYGGMYSMYGGRRVRGGLLGD